MTMFTRPSSRVVRGLSRGLAALVLMVLLGPVGVRAAEGELEVPPDLNALRAMAEAGQPRAQTELADILAGNGDFTNAVAWYRKAAQQGEVASQLTLATLLITGRGTAKNPQEAARWLRAAADRIEGSEPRTTNALVITRSNAVPAAVTNVAASTNTAALKPAPAVAPTLSTNTPKVRRADTLQSVPPALQGVPQDIRPPPPPR